MFTKRVTMQSAAAATGNGTAVTVHDVTTLGMQVAGTFVGTVTFEITVNDSDWGSLQVETVASGAVVTAATAPGIFRATVAGLSQVRARVSAWTSGTITVTAFATEAGGGISLADIDIQAGEAHIGEVGGRAIAITVTPTLTVGATYVANDFVGTNNTAMTFAGAARIAAGSGTVIGATLIDYAVASVAAELWLFSAAPAGLGLDSAAFTITDADSLLCIGVIPFSTYYASALNSISNGSIPNSNLPFRLASGTSLFGALVTRGAPAYTNGLVSVRIVVAQD